MYAKPSNTSPAALRKARYEAEQAAKAVQNRAKMRQVAGK